MARIDRAALDNANFPAAVTIPTRFADLDLQGHVNNAAVPVILQETKPLSIFPFFLLIDEYNKKNHI